VIQTGSTLTAAQAGAIYQWVDCNSGYTPIPGANGQSFTSAVAGAYALIITSGGCSDTSSCYTVVGIGTSPVAKPRVLEVRPNPAGEFFSVLGATGRVVVTDLVGHVVAELPDHEGDLSGWRAGVYLLRDESGAVCKLVRR
jgi:hypothetical protein